ncbi:2Fe-2S iron-sulfur cluster-binding protein [Vibrio crassostreae]|uniref:2Fe-2S iron-sulfur cluster-binding protein n=1 Tax=Vibrio crassostreae TaxID=246167 RepID=UPI001049EE87|nr:2Fe-2S iron-sulfur cluster protein [Vibrio crassostreae]
MTVEITINQQVNIIGKNELLAEHAQALKGGYFSCLKGKCGRCLVEIIDGDLGRLSTAEFEFLELLGLEKNGKYRLLCQGRAKSNISVRKF